MQLFIKSLLIIIFLIFNLYASVIFIRIILTKEIDVKYPLKWVKMRVENLIPTTTSGVNISPEKLVLKTKEWRGTSLINVSNDTSEILYNLYVKLIIENEGLLSEDVKIAPINKSNPVEVKMGNVVIDYAVVRAWGIDKNNKEAILLIIYSLAPHENKSFRIDLKASTLNTEEANISIKLIKYSRKPIQVLSQAQNKQAFPIEFLDLIKVKGYSLSMKRDAL